MRYRADIAGLRALAVIPVVLFHAEPRLVPGGFVGVDVFFVISGYLITSILAADLAGQGFSLTRFYDRRVRRILPAYGVMALVTTLVSLVLLPPDMLAAFGNSLKSASIFLANRYFLSVTAYFGPAAEEQPLLHTWSLAVEEQFYLFWPLLLALFAHPRLKRLMPYAVAALIAVSLVVATRNALLRPAPAFFNFNGRIWELLAGAALALGLLPALERQWQAEALAALGVALILGAAAAFDSRMVFPGATALVPVLGALLVLWAGEGGRRTWAGRGLSLAPLVWIGVISYSLYLWHWPILVFTRLVNGPYLPLPLAAAAVVAAVVMGALSWRFVEVPFRRAGFSSWRSELRTIAIGLCGLAGLAGIGIALSAAHGLPGRASPAALAAQAAAAEHWKATDQCLLGPNRTEPPAACRFGSAAAGAPLIALWGDSLANHHAPALDALARAEGFGLVQLTKAGCAARLPGEDAPLGHTREDEACDVFRARTLKAILADPAIRIVVVGGAWGAGPKGTAALASLAEAVRQLTTSGRGVILMTPMVAFANGGGRCIARRRFMGLDAAGCTVPAEIAAQGLKATETALADMAAASPLVRVVVVRERFCDAEICSPEWDGRVLMTDGGHLNVAGSMVLAPDLAAAFTSLLPALPPRP